MDSRLERVRAKVRAKGMKWDGIERLVSVFGLQAVEAAIDAGEIGGPSSKASVGYKSDDKLARNLARLSEARKALASVTITPPMLGALAEQVGLDSTGRLFDLLTRRYSYDALLEMFTAAGAQLDVTAKDAPAVDMFGFPLRKQKKGTMWGW